MERSLNSFSFEELSATEASRLQHSFQSFKNQLEGKFWGEKDEKSTEIGLADQNIRPVHPGKNQGELKLISSVCHGMKNPLEQIITSSELMAEGRLNKQQKLHLQTIQSASEGLVNTVNELLEYSKLAAGIEHFEEIPFHLKKLVRDVEYLCNTLILDKQIEFKVHTAPGIPDHLIGDPSKLSQILLNLLGNAIRFVEKGSVRLEVRMEEAKSRHVLLGFKVMDTGNGIPRRDLTSVFNSYQQSDHQTFEKYGGTGLGLSIIKKIIGRMSGGIQIQSEPGKGTALSFQIPFLMGEKLTATNQKTARARVDALKGMNVLVFEDNPLNQKLFLQRLKTWGCKVYMTENVYYGLQLLQDKPIDLVLMNPDINGNNGFALINKIRENPRKSVSCTPIIAISADYRNSEEASWRDKGCNDYIMTPYNPEELLYKIIQNTTDMQRNNPPTIAKMTSKLEKHKPEEVDLVPVLEDCMGQVSMLEDLIILYKQNVLEFIGATRIHLEQEDFEGLAFASHKVKCGLKMLNTQSLTALVEQIHTISRTNQDLKHLKFLHQCFLEEYPVVEAAIDCELLKLKKK